MSKIKVTRIKERYELETEVGKTKKKAIKVSVVLDKDIKTNQVTITPNIKPLWGSNKDSFTFKESNPALVKAIGRLLIKATEL